MKKTNVVVIGGGTGTVSVLNGIKYFDDLDISVIVSMTDDGGSNAIVRDEFGLLPLSDLRKSIIALADKGNSTLRELFTYRFSKGEGLSGHTLGNLIMMALSDISGDEVKAIDAASKIFRVLGKIIPVTLDDVRLVAEYADGSIVTGEHLIDEPEKSKTIKLLRTEPEAKANPEAIKVIENADYIVIGPGDMYTSTLANIIIGGIPEAIQKSDAKVIFINNLMTKKGQTHEMKLQDLVNEIERYTGKSPDFVINNSKEIPEDIKEKYAKSEEYPLEDNVDDTKYEVIRENVIGDEIIKRQSGDTLKRSLVRHDSKKLGDIIYNMIIKR